MANGKQSSKKRLNMAERAKQMMALHFKGVSSAWLWFRQSNDGYSTLPRTLPLAMQAIDDQSKGQPAGHTLFCLWMRAPDHPVLTIENPIIFASEAGFTGERAVDTWRRRMKRLKELSFISASPGASGDFHYVLLKNPNAAMEQMHNGGLLQGALYSRFIERLADIGAHSEIDAIREHWEKQKARKAKANAEGKKAKAAGAVVKKRKNTGGAD
jgi:hypothetical protein